MIDTCKFSYNTKYMENKALLLLHLKGRERSGQGMGFDEEEGRKKGTGERREAGLEGRDMSEKKESVRKGVERGGMKKCS